MKKFIYTASAALVLASGITSCELHQKPDGFGTDPTETIVAATVNVSLPLPELENGAETPLSRADGLRYYHRFVIEVMGDDQRVHEHKEYFLDVDNDATSVTLPVDLRLNARNYRLLVWSDYVNDNNRDTGWFYNCESLTPVYPTGKYNGNNIYKDAFDACAPLDLRPYADKWQAKVDIDVELRRPVGRYTLISTDLNAFRNKLNAGTISGKTFTARIRYSSYIPTGFNVLEQTPKNMLNYLSYNVNLGDMKSADNSSVQIAFDYVMSRNENVEIPLEIEIVNENNQLLSNCSINVPVKAGYNSIVRGRFLTATTDGGMSIDPDFDGSIDIDLGKL
ncbi:MAG: hypothetical protein K2L80_09160 [Muribaculaceae bacterium]|nr:hypothetical protein [Muribaculaceae bacterium]MDE6332758.1 hypothetical protein [Muribaculaceae bacterium]